MRDATDVVPELLELVESDDEAVRETAMSTVLEAKFRRAITDEQAAKLLGSKDPAVVAAFSKLLLGDSGRGAKIPPTVLFSIVESSDVELRRLAMRRILVEPVADSAAVLALLDSKHTDVRVPTAEFLSNSSAIAVGPATIQRLYKELRHGILQSVVPGVSGERVPWTPTPGSVMFANAAQPSVVIPAQIPVFPEGYFSIAAAVALLAAIMLAARSLQTIPATSGPG